jgi:very-short-patch-repair endonuclease
MTLHEKVLRFDFLKNLDCRVTKQRCIDHYIVDFYIASKNLVIEVDGDSHDSKEAGLYDDQRTIMLEMYNLRVLRVSNNDIIDNFE